MLADIQLNFRNALLAGDATGILPFLGASSAAAKRLGIHQRHYEASLTTALVGKFPGTEWLVGSGYLTDAARRFAHSHPPRAPCIAEYGADFPAYLAACPQSQRFAYLQSFAELEWCVGQASVAIEIEALPVEVLSTLNPEHIPGLRLGLQPGVTYREAAWPVDDLLRLYWTDSAPEQLAFAPERIFLEIRGARGEFRLGRLDRAAHIFRAAIASGETIEAATEGAQRPAPDFDAGHAVVALFAEGLVTSLQEPSEHQT